MALPAALPAEATTGPAAPCDVLVVGAGPTGLTLAAQLARFGVHCRIIDGSSDRARESRALAIQPRTLEVLRPLGVAGELVRRGNPNVRMLVHGRAGRIGSAPMFDIGMNDTAYPFLLFLAQSETEAVLLDRLAGYGLTVERETRLESLHDDGHDVTCTVRDPDGATHVVRARYVVGCDGPRSSVRSHAGIGFSGGRYPQTFLLADLDVGGLEPDAIHVFIGPSGPLLFFPLKAPAPWRLVTVRPTRTATAPDATDVATAVGPVTKDELADVCAAATDRPLELQEPLWATAFRVSHRHATAYRRGRLFIAGDAAHVHSPAGAQGMNTGIQDAINLGWKLALVVRGVAPEALLDSYDDERRPVGAFVLRFTDRAFTVVTSGRPLVRAMRSAVAPRVLPLVLRSRLGRRLAFRTVSQLGIRYGRSLAVQAAQQGWRRRLAGRLSRSRPRPGDRLPDGRVACDGRDLWLHEALADPALHLLLCGPAETWDPRRLRERFGPLLQVHYLSRRAGAGVIHDATGDVLEGLHVHGNAAFVVRPDGHIGARSDGTDLAQVDRYLSRILRPMSPG